ncbi:type IA DNA topoisomerase [Rhodopseudomonas palustris]|nr:type IA DNA topoisomerase [Rhodopseudomonas palustris]
MWARGLRHAPQERIVRREVAEAVTDAARLRGRAIRARRGQAARIAQLHDLPSLQKLCGSRFGWLASKTLEVAQQLYDGPGKKIITYPRAEVRYLPQSLIAEGASHHAIIPNVNAVDKLPEIGLGCRPTRRNHRRRFLQQPHRCEFPLATRKSRSSSARVYRNGGWFAPPGVDLAAFSERGWL